MNALEVVLSVLLGLTVLWIASIPLINWGEERLRVRRVVREAEAALTAIIERACTEMVTAAEATWQARARRRRAALVRLVAVTKQNAQARQAFQ